MPRNIKLKPTIFSKKNLPIQIPTTTNRCTCGKHDRGCSSIKSITNHNELMALVNEPIFITGRNDWQMTELIANTRELGMCKHFMNKLTPDYLCNFVQELLQKKRNYLKEQTINYPVTFYAWFYYCPTDMGGRPFLCYDFISGYKSKLPFGGKYLQGIHTYTFMRKFLNCKTRRDRRKFYVFTATLNKEHQNNSDTFSEKDCEFLHEKFWGLLDAKEGW